MTHADVCRDSRSGVLCLLGKVVKLLLHVHPLAFYRAVERPIRWPAPLQKQSCVADTPKKGGQWTYPLGEIISRIDSELVPIPVTLVVFDGPTQNGWNVWVEEFHDEERVTIHFTFDTSEPPVEEHRQITERVSVSLDAALMSLVCRAAARERSRLPLCEKGRYTRAGAVEKGDTTMQLNTEFLNFSQAQYPGLIAQLLEAFERFVEINHPKELPAGAVEPPGSLLNDDGTGSYALKAHTLTPEAIATLRRDFADGIINEEFCKYLAGLVQGIMLMAGGA